LLAARLDYAIVQGTTNRYACRLRIAE